MFRICLFFVLAVTACKSEPKTPHPDDADPERSCAQAEQNLLELGCKDSRGRKLGGPNLKGEPFRSICVTAINHRVSMRPVCLARITRCDDAQSCLDLGAK